MSNLKVRLAVNHAIDRDAITGKLLRGMGEPLGQLATPPIFGYDPSIKPPKYDVALAKKLLQEAGYKGEKILFQYPNNRWAFAEQVAQAIGGYLGAAGLNVQLQSMEFSAFFPLWVANKLPALYMFSMGITILDADLLLNLEYETGTSHGYWTSPEVDELARKQRAEKDPEKRKQALSRIWQLSLDNAAFAPLYVEIQAYGVRDGVAWSPRPDERLIFGKR
jgi:peptide/nickel transport system substrate-binding protein